MNRREYLKQQDCSLRAKLWREAWSNQASENSRKTTMDMTSRNLSPHMQLMMARSMCQLRYRAVWHPVTMQRWTHGRAPAMKTQRLYLCWTTSQTKASAVPLKAVEPSDSTLFKSTCSRKRTSRWCPKTVSSLSTRECPVPRCSRVPTQTHRCYRARTVKQRGSHCKEKQRKRTKNRCLIWANQLRRLTKFLKRSSNVASPSPHQISR